LGVFVALPYSKKSARCGKSKRNGCGNCIVICTAVVNCANLHSAMGYPVRSTKPPTPAPKLRKSALMICAHPN
jgi:hypothetical protein